MIDNPTVLNERQERRSRPRHRSKTHFIRKMLAAATVAGLVLGGLATMPATSAQAATTGAGYSDGGEGFLGNYIAPDGSRAYCIDVLADWPSGATGGATLVGVLDAAPGSQGVSGDGIRQLNTGLRQYGETGDPVQAAAMNAIVYAYTSANHNGYAGGVHYINTKAPGQSAAITAKYAEIWNYIQANWNPTVSPGSGSMTFAISATNNYNGTLTVNLTPSNATGSVTLTNGTFASTGAVSMTGVTNGQVLQVKGNPPDNSGRQYQIKASGSFSASVAAGPAENVRLYETPGQQRIIRGGDSSSSTVNFNLEADDPYAKTTFQPVLTTEVGTRLVTKGSSFTDVLTFSTVADAEGTNNPWRQTRGGSYFPVTATGTLYGPLSTKPTESATPPAGAPVAATATVTTTTAAGPTTSYTATGSNTATASGYYTWVWKIAYADQTALTKLAIPENYSFSDRYGRAAETHVVQFQPAATSQVSAAFASPGATVTDTLTVSNTGGTWPEDVSVKFEGTAYAVASGTHPPVSGTVPSSGVSVLGTRTITATGPGTYTSGSVTMPDDAGYVTWVWKVVKANQSAAVREMLVGDWSDSFGLAAETTTVRFQPAVTTEVSSRVVTVGQKFNDEVTARASDGVWLTGTSVTAVGTLYGPFTTAPTESATPPAGAPVAGTETLTFTAPGTKTTAGTITASASGFYTWVWKIVKTDQVTATQSRIVGNFTDRFGITAETHLVPFQPVAVSQVDQETVKADDEATDTIVVSAETGTWPTGLEVTYFGTAYGWTGTTPPAESSTVPAGAVKIADVEIVADGPGSYQSPEITVPGDVSYVTWVWRIDKAASVPAASAGVISADWQDAFGLAEETSTVQFQPTVSTVVSSKFVKKGQPFIDVLQSGVSSGIWLDGVEVEAEGTLYGPFLHQPDEADAAPWFAPKLGTETVTLGGVGEYLSPGTLIADEAGYYTWVWKIVKNDQPAATKAVIMGDFTDRFGQVAETHVSPSSIIGVSAVTEEKVALSEKIQDTLTVSVGAGGGWITADGKRVPVTFRATAYLVPGDVAPAVSTTVPDSAIELGTTTLTASKPGTYTSEELTAPDAQGGWISWVWEVREDDQPEQYRGYVEEWQDQFGLSNETQQIMLPVVVTEAQPLAAPGLTMTDTAVITGTMPATPSTLHFSVYQAVEGESAASCTPENLLFSNADAPLTVTATGRYRSPEVPVPGFGAYYWVETLTSSEGNVIVEGVCGLENETTIVEPPKVATKAQPATAITETATDTAIVDGAVPNGTTVVFDLYRQPQAGDTVVNEDGETVTLTEDDITGLPVCTPENLYGTTRDEPVLVRAGINTGAEYASPAIVLEETGVYFWVETVESEEWGVLHTGICGAEGETTIVELPTVVTEAVPEVELGQSAHDTAIVDGLVPDGAQVEFSAYKQDGTTATCTPATRVFDSTGKGVAVTAGLNEAARYEGPKHVFTEAGTYYWVETLFVIHDGDTVILHQGECGAPGETTTIRPPLPVTGFTGSTALLVGGSALLAGALLLLLLQRRRRQSAEAGHIG